MDRMQRAVIGAVAVVYGVRRRRERDIGLKVCTGPLRLATAFPPAHLSGPGASPPSGVPGPGSDPNLGLAATHGESMKYATVNPFTGELVKEYPNHSAEDVERALAAADAA
jgi:hypothetical protein